MLAPERLPDPLLEPHLPVLAPMLPAVLPGPGGLQQQHARVVPRGLVPRRAEVLGPLDVPVLPGPEDYVVAEVARLQHGPEALGRVGPGPGLARSAPPPVLVLVVLAPPAARNDDGEAERGAPLPGSPPHMF